MKSSTEQFDAGNQGQGEAPFVDIEAEVLEPEPEIETKDIDVEVEDGKPEREAAYADVEVVDGEPTLHEERRVESNTERQSKIDKLRKQIEAAQDAEIVSEDNTPLTLSEKNRFRKKEEVIVNAKMTGGFSWGLLGSLFGKAFKLAGKASLIVGSIALDMWDSLSKSFSGPTTKAKG